MSKITDKVYDTIQSEQTIPATMDVTALPLVLTVDETADLLRVNRKTIYEMVSRDELPGAVRTGRKIRISSRAVLDWLNGQGRAFHTTRSRS